MSTRIISVPKQMWFEEGERELEFPESWEVIPCLMKGHNAPPITPAKIRTALIKPIGTLPLRQLAQRKNEVVIIFDDLTRPTKVAELAPFVIEELEAAGIPDSAIRFVCALASHGPLSRQSFQKKLGDKILNRFPVYNHNVYENCKHVGNTSRGTKVSINAEVMNCDLKIGIGSILPHSNAGYGGGAKIILPGVAYIDTIEANHLLAKRAQESGEPRLSGMGNYEENPERLDIEEAVRMIGTVFKLDTIVNGRGQPCALFAGDIHAAFREGVKFAEQHYVTEPPSGIDVTVVNTYCKGSEAIIGLLPGIRLLADKGGDLVLIIDCPAGQVVHYLRGSFGKSIGGRLFNPITTSLPWIRRLIILSRYFEKSLTDWLAVPDIIWVKTWDEVMAILTQDFPNGAKVAVIPDGTIQYFA